MARKDIDTTWDRLTRNNLNDNFEELYEKYTGAGLSADEAKEKALESLRNSEQALLNSEQAKSETEEWKLCMTEPEEEWVI